MFWVPDEDHPPLDVSKSIPTSVLAVRSAPVKDLMEHSGWLSVGRDRDGANRRLGVTSRNRATGSAAHRQRANSSSRTKVGSDRSAPDLFTLEISD
jgi:hypothetical protein